MATAAAVFAAAPGGAATRYAERQRADRFRVAHSGRRAAAGLCVGSNGARPVSTYSLHRPAAALVPTRGASTLRRRRSCAAAATSGRARLAVAAAASGEPRPDFATKGEFTKDGQYALKYLYDGGAPGQRARAPRLSGVGSGGLGGGLGARHPRFLHATGRCTHDACAGCSVCTALVTMLKSRAGHEKIFFENIVAPSFTPQRNAGITKKDAMATIHVSAFPAEGQCGLLNFAALR